MPQPPAHANRVLSGTNEIFEKVSCMPPLQRHATLAAGWCSSCIQAAAATVRDNSGFEQLQMVEPHAMLPIILPIGFEDSNQSPKPGK